MNDMESLTKNIDTLRESLENTLQNFSNSFVGQSYEEYLRRVIEFFDSSLQLIELIISLIETFAKDSKLMGDHFGLFENEKGWIEMRNIAEKMQRRRSLLAPSNSDDFLADLMWFSQRGDENDLALIEKVKNNPLYTSDEIIYLLNIIPSMISSRSSKVIDQTYNNPLDIPRYRVHCSKCILEATFKNISILHEYAAFCIIAAPQNIIDVIRRLFPVDSFNIPAQNDSQGSFPMSTLARDQVIRFNAPILKNWVKSISDIGGRILEPLGGSEIVVSIPTPEIFKQILNFPWVAQITPYRPKVTVKLQDLLRYSPGMPDPRLSDGSSDYDEVLPGILIANFFTTDDRNQAAENLEAEGIRVIDKPGQRKLVLDLYSDSKISESFELIIQQVGLQSLSEKVIPRSCNAPARALLGRGVVPSNPTPSLGLTGKNQVIAICDERLDTGDPGTIHLDFRGRVRSIQSYPIPLSCSTRYDNVGHDGGASDIITGHGTHVAGSALGNARQSQQLGLSELPSGMAPDAQLVGMVQK